MAEGCGGATGSRARDQHNDGDGLLVFGMKYRLGIRLYERGNRRRAVPGGIDPDAKLTGNAVRAQASSSGHTMIIGVLSKAESTVWESRARPGGGEQESDSRSDDRLAIAVHYPHYRVVPAVKTDAVDGPIALYDLDRRSALRRPGRLSCAARDGKNEKQTQRVTPWHMVWFIP